MFNPPSGLDWRLGLLWLAGILLAGFVVSWVLTDRIGVRRGGYIAWLALATGGLAAGYLAWSGQGGEFWSARWGWGVVAAALAGGLLWVLVHRVPIPAVGQPGLRAGDLLWQAGVYGVVEGLLLSVLPVAVTWQAFAAAGWTGGGLVVPAAIAALAASAALIVVHHFGYVGYRGRRVIMPLIGCVLLSVVYLLTLSPIAAMGGHAILHVALLHRGIEMPPEASGREAAFRLRPSAPSRPGTEAWRRVSAHR